MLKNLYCIVGKSGSGKSTITEELQRRYGYVPLSSYTDRPKRFENETGHVFVTPEEFHQLGPMIAYTMFNGHQYGATQELVDNSDLYLIDPDGIRFLKERYRSNRPIRVIGLFAPEEKLIQRMKERGDSLDMIVSRRENDKEKFRGMDELCDVIIRNDDLEDALRTIQSIINRYEGIELGLFKNENVTAPHRIRLFVDMDGTLCKWKVITQEEDLFSKGWFRDMEPIQSVVDAVKMIRARGDMEVFIMTAVMEESPYAKKEKKEWVKEHLPGFEDDHILFVPYGKHKHEFTPGGMLPTDMLLDDYSWNLHEWAKHGIAIKIKTDSNGTKGTWKGPMVHDSMQPKEIADILEGFLFNSQVKE